MPGKIQILSELLMKRIAAGEVIERAASVVKELLENAVDAEATEITLAIEDAGDKLIQVTDDGTGMSEEDALLCARRARFATCTISTPFKPSAFAARRWRASDRCRA
jgi:DNA mismatch repair ATPase MutL